MKNMACVLALIGSMLLINLPTSKANMQIDSLIVPDFGEVYVYLPANQAKSVAVLISGDGGWDEGIVDFAKHFAATGNLVIGVNVNAYFKVLRSRKDACYNCSSDFVNLATNIEKKYQLPAYQAPVVMGYSRGATLVYALLAQARAGTFRGGISLGFCTEVDLPKPFCHLNRLEKELKNKDFQLKPDLKLANRWIVLQGKLDKVCNFKETLDYVSKTSDAELIILEGVNHGFRDEAKFMPQWDQAYLSLLKTDTAPSQKMNQNPIEIQKLPLTITNANAQSKDAPFVIFISGDGGWYSFEQRISDRLAALGIPSVGFDTKKYFWNRRTPQATAEDIAKIIQTYSAKWEKNSYILMGYSLGAEVLPFVLNRLTAQQRANVSAMVLLSPHPAGDFEIHLSTMLGLGSYKDDYDVRKEITLIPALFQQRTLLINGDQEKATLPAQLLATKVRFATVPGDHHYDGNTASIVQVLQKKGIIHSYK